MPNIKKNKKKVKKGLSDNINRKKNLKPVVNIKEKVSTNPFEVKVNKKKFDILGRKQKEEKGLPGVARQKAIKKRQETLLPMLKDRYKTNKFVDKRLGEGDNSMSLEDKMMARFAAERAKTSSKKALFSLEETEDAILTHRGQSLAEIERFDDPRSDDEEEEMGGKLGANITEAHFGGGLLSKKEGGPTPIEQLIAESKKRKDERQKIREETADLTDQLDSDYKAVAELLGGMKRKVEDDEEPLQDAYDVAVKQLKYEARAKPTDKLKTADEIAKEEAERLKRLEEERMRRMNPEAKRKTVDHLSADALDDSYLLPIVRKKPEVEHAQEEGEVEQRGESGIEEDDEVSAEDEESSEGSDEEEAFSDLASDESGSESEEEKPKAKKLKKETEKVKISAEEISTALPYVVKVPKTYEDFTALLSSHPPKDQIVLLDRMFRCNHPTLSGENKSKIENLFKFLIQLIHDLGREAEEDENQKENPCSILPSIGTIMFEIIGLLPQPCCTALRDVITEHFDDSKNKSGKAPISLDLVLFLKLVGLLCPTSDYKHPVTTPAVILVSHLLGSSLVTSFDRVVRGLMLSAVLLEYIALSKRYSPELFNFLLGVLILASPKKPKSITAIPHPFKGFGPEASLLVLAADSSKSTDPVPKLTPSDLRSTDSSSDVQKIAALHTGVNLMSDCLSLWKDHPSYSELGSWVAEAVERISVDMYPEEVKKSIADLKDKTNEKTVKRKLVHPERRPKMLKLYEPKFEESYDGRKKMKGNPAKAEEQKLNKQYKREMKGAIREVRRDTAFIARAQLKEQLQKDTERKEKVKRLLGSLAMQEGDFKKLKRGKK